jgi:hypothetical protein
MSRITYYRGDTYPIELTITDVSGNPVDLSGVTFKMTVNSDKTPVDDSTKLFQVNGVLDYLPTTGKVYFTPTALNTALSPGKYYYDIQMLSPNGNIRTLVKDEFRITQDITK